MGRPLPKRTEHEGPGVTIWRRRIALNLTQAELAQRLMVHHDTIGRWERGVTVPHGRFLEALTKLEEENRTP